MATPIDRCYDCGDVKKVRLMKIRFFCIFALLLTLSSCFKDEEYDTQLIVRPSIQYITGGEFSPYTGCVAYAFAADTANWEILSWEDARDGVLSRKGDSSDKRAPIATAVSYEEEGLDAGSMLKMQVNRETALIVVANTIDETYAYKIYTVGLNLSKTYVYTLFRSWKTEDYKESYWEYIVPTI